MMGSGEWGVGNGESGVGSGEWGVGKRLSQLQPGEKYEDRILSGPGHLETWYGNRRRLLSPDPQLSERRVIRNDTPNSQSEFFGSGEYRGGIWQGEHQGLHSLPANRSGQSEGKRNPPDSFQTG